MSGGGGGSAHAQTSMNQAAELRGVSTRRWEGREWVWFVSALVPRRAPFGSNQPRPNSAVPIEFDGYGVQVGAQAPLPAASGLRVTMGWMPTIDHVALACRDPVRSLRFYRDVVRVEGRVREEEHGFLIFTATGVSLTLLRGEPPPTVLTGWHISIGRGGARSHDRPTGRAGERQQEALWHAGSAWA